MPDLQNFITTNDPLAIQKSSNIIFVSDKKGINHIDMHYIDSVIVFCEEQLIRIQGMVHNIMQPSEKQFNHNIAYI